MIADVAVFLRCPHCAGNVAFAGKRLSCDAGHSFDSARHGYVNLMPGGGTPHRGDDAAMVSARERFLRSGHFDGIQTALELTAVHALLNHRTPPAIVDAGAGTGYYLAGLLRRLPSCTGIALDSSRYALRRAARAHPRIGAVGCDVWGMLPVRDGVAALILNIFSPRNGAEFHRVLKDDGRLIVVTPTPAHLAELVEQLGLVAVDGEKPRRLSSELSAYFTLDQSVRHEEAVQMDGAAAASVVKMGPSARHFDANAIDERLAALLHKTRARRLPVTISVDISVYRKSRPATVPDAAASRSQMSPARESR